MSHSISGRNTIARQGLPTHLPSLTRLNAELSVLGMGILPRERFLAEREEDAVAEDEKWQKIRLRRFTTLCDQDEWITHAIFRRKPFLRTGHDPRRNPPGGGVLSRGAQVWWCRGGRSIYGTMRRSWASWCELSRLPWRPMPIFRPADGEPPNQLLLPLEDRSAYTLPEDDIGTCQLCGEDHHPRCSDLRHRSSLGGRWSSGPRGEPLPGPALPDLSSLGSGHPSAPSAPSAAESPSHRDAPSLLGLDEECPSPCLGCGREEGHHELCPMRG